MPIAALAARFPPGFRFGTMSAAPQVEGAAAEDGRGPSIWDSFAAVPHHVMDGSTPQVAADHYHRHADDVALLGRLGAPSYKMSVSWSRVLPEGTGLANPKGVAFYDRLIDEVLAQGLEPTVTLCHWDLPQALEYDGGWVNRETADHFAEYASFVAGILGDRVSHWIPLHEPARSAFLGYGVGRHAPGLQLAVDSGWAAHHLLLGHGRAVQALRTAGARSIGAANIHAPIWPASEDPADVGATKLFDAVWNGCFLEPMLMGRYPADVAAFFNVFAEPGDLSVIRQPLDFYGIDYHSPGRVRVNEDESAVVPFTLAEIVGHPRTANGHPVVPDALQELLIMTRARYRAALPPLVVTCGAAYADEDGEDGDRIDYLTTHLEAVANAIAVGVDVRGFHVRSLLDSWEWQDGFMPRYGLVAVDPVTHERRPRQSFEWYGELVAAHAAGGQPVSP